MPIEIQNSRDRRPVLRALDSDLPLLATRAAIEIDGLLAEEETGLESVSELASLLSSAQVEVTSEGSESLFDPATLTVLSQAMSESELGRGMTSVSDLVKKSMEVAGLLKSGVSETTERPELERLKKFCIVLSNLAASYRQSVFGDGARQPYKA